LYKINVLCLVQDPDVKRVPTVTMGILKEVSLAVFAIATIILI